jgi:hypothetical protein
VQCQYKCYRDEQCAHFTFFAKGEIKKCVMFKDCDAMDECRSVSQSVNRESIALDACCTCRDFS